MMKYKISEGDSGHRQRLRERFLKAGLENLQDYEIIELLLILGTPRRDCKQQARELLLEFGSLKAVLEAEPVELQRIKGVGPSNIFGLKLIRAMAERYLKDRIIDRDFIESSEQVIEFLSHALSIRDRETFLVVYLNGRDQVLGSEEIFSGTLTTSAVYPREVVKKALANKAAAMIFEHNHPSGNLNPSKDDIAITKKLKTALATIDVAVHDHIIIAGNGHYSMADHGLL
ncbi:MAG: DNA repair protein RadC [Candidatus Marinimicrobia bacterium]|nr:DNA repair protein RadC [Candidatus Neomarinimicrobiota bacterium]